MQRLLRGIISPSVIRPECLFAVCVGTFLLALQTSWGAPGTRPLRLPLESCGELILNVPTGWEYVVGKPHDRVNAQLISLRPADEEDRSFEAFLELAWRTGGKRLYFKKGELPADKHDLSKISKGVHRDFDNGHVHGETLFLDSKTKSGVKRYPGNPARIVTSYRYSTEVHARVGWGKVRLIGLIATQKRSPEIYKSVLKMIAEAKFVPEQRTWHAKSGKTMEAALYSSGAKTVTLRTASGKRVKIRRELLSDADCEYIDRVAANDVGEVVPKTGAKQKADKPGGLANKATGAAEQDIANTKKLMREYGVRKVSVELNIPLVRQKPNYCGATCLEMASIFYGARISQDKVIEKAGRKFRKIGLYWSDDLKSTMRKLHVKFKGGFEKRGGSRSNSDVKELIHWLGKGNPVILGVHSNPAQKNQDGDSQVYDHLVLLVGYDLGTQTLTINDPARSRPRTLTFDAFRAHRVAEAPYEGQTYSLYLSGMRRGSR